jgi:Sulfite exporter TauE/SafE.
MSTINGLEILNNSPLLFWIIAVVAVLAVSISKSGFGGALGSFSVPIMLFVLPPKLALGVLLPLFLVTDIWVVYIWRKMLEKRTLVVMCLFGVLGQVIGWLIFDYLNDHILSGLIGLIAIITALNYAWKR